MSETTWIRREADRLLFTAAGKRQEYIMADKQRRSTIAQRATMPVVERGITGAIALTLLFFVAACTGSEVAGVDDGEPGSDSVLPSSTPSQEPAEGVVPAAAPGLVRSAGSGTWNDASVWEGGVVPDEWFEVVIAEGDSVVVDEPVDVSGLRIETGGRLEFEPGSDVVLRSAANVVVNGDLVMGWGEGRHELLFVGVDELQFVGGGMAVLESDVGLWVMDGGVLLAEGAEKRGWSRAVGGIPSGTIEFEVEDASGWLPGDRIVIAPTRGPTEIELEDNYDGFHESTIVEVEGNVVTMANPTAAEHPLVNDEWTAEVMNLSRSVVIGGSDFAHKAHVFFHSSRPSHLKYVEVRFMGPGQILDGGWEGSGQTLGRYGLHWHHNGMGSVGTIVEGVALHDFGFRGFVPHVSHGITFRDTVAYYGGGAAYWWDATDPSHDILWDRTIGAKVSSGDGVYFLGTGDNVEVRDSVAVGSLVKSNSGGFEWENVDTGSWEFTGNIAHNLRGNGIRVWQNTQENHVLSNFAVYNVTDIAVRIGAYINNYHLKDFTIYGYGDAGLELLAVPRQPHQETVRPSGMLVEHGVVDGAGRSTGPSIAFRESAKAGNWPIRVRDVVVRGRDGQEVPAVWLFEGANDKKIHLIDVTIEDGPTPDFLLADGTDLGIGDGQSWIRVQNPTESYLLRPGDQNLDPGAVFVEEWNAWKVEVDRALPEIWGTGTGLLGEYFDDIELTDKHFEAIDPYIEFLEEEFPIYHTLDGAEVGVRWTGRIEAQRTGTHLIRPFGDIVRFWIDGELVIDTEADFDVQTVSVDLVAGQQIEIRLELGHRAERMDDTFFLADLIWTQPGEPFAEYIQQSQLYPPEGVADRPFTPNDPAISPEPGTAPAATINR